MRLLGLLTILLLFVFSGKAQDLYVFESTEVQCPAVDVFHQENYLSVDLCRKLAQFDLVYTRKIKNSAQRIMASTEIIKPDLYYSIRKLADYYCKCLKKGIVTQEKAERELQSILDKCIQIASKNTTPIEAELRAANNPQEIVGIFDKIIIK
ncbi:MAG: hypothetical protein AAGU19_06475 [Prolixibacteraceae bacterium]